MAFSDLRYGWHQGHFELRDVSLSGSIELQGLDKDGKWHDRSPLVFSDDIHAETEPEQRAAAQKYESVDQFRYSRPRRNLRAKARSQDFDALYLGVPADKRTVPPLHKSKLDHIDLSIRAITDVDALKLVRSGGVGYAKARESHPDFVYAELYVTDEVFDDIERTVTQPNVALSVSINVRGWYWLGPVADSQVYINAEQRERAEFGSISAIRTVPNVVPLDGASIDGNGPDHPAGPLEDMRRRLVKVESQLGSIKSAAWVIAAAAGAIALRLFFRA
jgi:hypothetical protein